MTATILGRTIRDGDEIVTGRFVFRVLSAGHSLVHVRASDGRLFYLTQPSKCSACKWAITNGSQVLDHITDIEVNP